MSCEDFSIPCRIREERLELTPRQIRRLRATLRQAGPAGLAHRSRERPAHNRLAAPLRAQVIALARGRYTGLNDVHLTEKLTAVEGLPVSRATVRRLLRAAGVGLLPITAKRRFLDEQPARS